MTNDEGTFSGHPTPLKEVVTSQAHAFNRFLTYRSPKWCDSNDKKTSGHLKSPAMLEGPDGHLLGTGIGIVVLG